ncbi:MULTISPECIES: glycogen synthase GlgA [Ruminococcus]|uniref:glycogen synthase GlgA n=1 Tax=Ruminococcus TaxID=1263 RepID=UPI00033D94D1|nr:MULTISPECIES: glycogen synthase GlgA [Ruminococcus]CDD53996.1 glycogen synthase 1 [Ruminococcus sp. CAG:379]
MNILFAASEALPYVASGGLADVAGSLPSAIVKKGHDCRVVIPLYKCISAEMRASLTFLTNITVDVSWRKQYCGIFTGIYKGVTYYFIDNEYYFGRDGIYGFYDDCERFVFYSRAVLEMIRCIDFKPDIIHANDWQAAMIPVYYQIFYKYQQGYENIHTIFTIHNIQYQGKYGKEVLNELMGIPLYHTGLLEYDGCVNMMKGAIETADKITTVSPSYAWEILDPWYSHGLDRALNTKQYKLCGFLNGIDVDGYNPETDPAIPANYSVKNMQGKAKCKQALLEELGLQDGDEPIIGIVTRFVSHKGIDLIRYVFEDILNLGYKFAILGSGEKIFEDFFKEMAWRHPGRVSVTLGFIPQLARRIYAGCDMFLMPSQSEPCGLAQMVAMRYGTLPIVRETGGLRDTVRDGGGENGNGFTFKTYNAHDMLGACNRAKIAYDDKPRWKALQKTAMESDFSWNVSAELYLGLYRELTEQHT